MVRTERSSPSFKKGGHSTTGQRVLRETLKNARRTNLSMLEESIGWTYNAILTSVQIKAKDTYWQVVVKAIFEHGPMVAFIDCDGFGRACEVTAELADTKGFRWHRDKYPNWSRGRRRSERYVASSPGGVGSVDKTLQSS